MMQQHFGLIYCDKQVMRNISLLLKHQGEHITVSELLKGKQVVTSF